ncbi:MAG: hypothetical protein KGD64_12045 [Candidatus Heimdallarchaeota archaeon]|nr:hypothetical protein [Candidatus Heimdallarchaeota archaeon]
MKLENLLPDRANFQIYCYHSTKETFNQEFDQYKVDESFKEMMKKHMVAVELV